MEHIAILDKKRRLLQKIILGEKIIESRWYKTKKTPYGIAKKGDMIYFKDSGEPVTAKAEINDVKFFFLDKNNISEILAKYGKAICLKNFNTADYMKYKYCTLLFLKNVEEIAPFEINKKGFGVACAWMTIDDVGKIRK